MRKFSFLFICFIFVSQLYAQELKLIGGINFSSYAIHPEVVVSPPFPPYPGGEYHYEKKRPIGFLFGVGIEFSLSSTIAIEIDGLYLQKGCDIKFLELSDLRWNYNLDILSVPILVKIKPLSKKLIYILGGGEFSRVLSHKENGLSITENTKIFDLGFILGGGVKIKIPNNALLIEGRYHIGLINIAKEDLRFDSIRTNAFVLLLAFKI
jgi:hypothetical protein